MSQNDRPQVIVVGAGVIGLSTAIRLLESGFRVLIRTKARSPGTTSDVSAALWFPFEIKFADDATLMRATRRGVEVFKELLGVPDAGVLMIEGAFLVSERVEQLPWWWDVVDAPRRASPAELRGWADGFVFQVPMITMSTYMPWLEQKFRALGGVIEDREVRSLDSLLEECPIVVNCTGIGARELASDEEVFPIRGQLVAVAPNVVSRFTIALNLKDPTTHVFIAPRTDHTVLGGIADRGSWDLTAHPEVAEEIRQRCIALEPSLASAPFVMHKVGLRPGRNRVRLETEKRPGGFVVHNYGHGGAGVTYSWPCAEEATQLVVQTRAQL